MGRLFWKFFFFIMLAQCTAILGISATLWLQHRNEDRVIRHSARQDLVGLLLDTAEIALQQGGAGGLDRLADNLRRYQVYAIDEQGRDVLGRSIGADEIARARLRLNQASTMVRQISGPDRQLYLLFHAVPDDVMRQRMPGPPPGIGLLMPPPQRDPKLPPPPPGSAGRFVGGPPSDGGFHFLLPLVCAGLASLLFAALLAWYVSRPIRILRSIFAALAAGDLSARVGAGMGRRRDELADLGREVDSMAEKIGALVHSQRQLLHDVSHEMRSPLARLQTAIGLARQQPEQIEATLDRLERESVRMDRLIGELLTLSRIEAGVLGPLEEINAAELIDEVVNNASFEAQAQHKSVRFIGLAEVYVSGRCELLYRALENVIRNAVRHSAEGGEVSVVADVGRDGKLLHIAILDQGPGVPEAELEVIFEPFYRGIARGDAARDSDKDSGPRRETGYGLGLTIARRVIVAHGGSICASNLSAGGLRVEISLPLGCINGNAASA